VSSQPLSTRAIDAALVVLLGALVVVGLLRHEPEYQLLVDG
jgi:hypothetical protein